MPGPQDLMALMQGGGGGGGQAQALVQKLQELMQDPVAMKGMMQHAQQMGLDPAMLAQAPGASQAPPPPGPMDMTQGIPPGAAEPGMNPPPGMQIPPGQEQDMVSQEIDRVGSTWDGDGVPTENDIERLRADPSQTNIDSFNLAFGEGAAEEVLGGAGEKTERDPREAGKGMEGPPEEEDEEKDVY